MKLNIPKHILEKGKIEYERILNEVPKKETKQSPLENKIILPTNNLSFVENENLYKEINKYLSKEFPTLKNSLEFTDKVMKHSNSYLAIAIDMYLKNEMPTHRIATQADLETNLPMFKDFYVDSGLALRNLTGENKKQANFLYDQLQKRNPDIKFPIWLNLQGLELDKNLNFNLTDESIFSTQESLNWEDETSYSKVNDLGLPKEKDESSNRKIWTSDNALSSCYLNRYSYLVSINSNLSISSDNGRVVLAKIA